jgi:colicin import membrane protein
MSAMMMNKTCALAMEKACLAYVSEIMDELERRGVMTSESLEAASAVLNEMRVTTGKPKKAKAAKVKKAVVETPAHLIPFCGTVNDKWCCGARVNHGLYTQCTKGREEGEDYCKVCQKQSDKNSSELPNGGDIRERVAKGAEWRDPKGKSPITFATLLTKPKFSGLTWESAEAECTRFGWTIPESERVASETKRGRPKKVVEVSDTDSEDGDKPKRTRGRPKKQPAKKQELSELIKQQALAAVAELSDSDGEVPLTKVEAKPKVKKVKKVKAPKQPSQKALKAQAFREKLVKEINEVDSTISYDIEIFNQSNAELRTFLKEAKVAKKAKDNQAKKEAVEKLKADKAAAKELEKAAKKEAADKVKADKAAAKELEKAAKKEAADKVKADKAAAKELEKAAKKEAADKVKAEKKAAKKEASDKLKAEKKAAKELEKAVKLAEKDASKEVEKAKKLAAVKAKIAAIEAPQLEEEDENIVLGELTLDNDEVAVEQAMPFNITTGKCFKGEDAEYFAMCDDTSFPEAKPDEEGDICLYNAEGEMVATYEDGVVMPLDDEE